MFGRLSPAIITGLVCALLLIGAPAVAQQQQQQQQEIGEISDTQLDKAAHAYLEITKLGESFRQEMQTAGDESERHELQQQANREMTGAVQQEGLEVQEYNQIIQRIQTDNDLMKNFMAKLQEIQ
jgi:RecA/RadA recombinase